jgi:multidrug transporter EmrE-like cation transporter
MERLQEMIHAHAVGQNWGVIAVLVVVNLLFNITSNTGLKMSADSNTWRAFLLWQVVGNLGGFVALVSVTALLRFLPLGVIFPVTTGLMIIGVEVVAAYWLFGEAIGPTQWTGTLLVVLGILLIGAR